MRTEQNEGGDEGKASACFVHSLSPCTEKWEWLTRSWTNHRDVVGQIGLLMMDEVRFTR